MLNSRQGPDRTGDLVDERPDMLPATPTMPAQCHPHVPRIPLIHSSCRIILFTNLVTVAAGAIIWNPVQRFHQQ